ncbi:MAG: LysR family transcriptional regulator [Atopobiaceae bacterium]|nr:LysR family transcriptional regulator [Atopobiaceae bacterium]
MDFQKMEAFIAVASTGKFTDAADRLFVSQSSLSKQIGRLEREIGVDLFKKTRSGVELTPAGWEFYTYARKAVREYHEVSSRLASYIGGKTNPINVGSLPLTEEYGLADAFSTYWVENPSVQIEYRERSQQDLLTNLDIHKLDLAFGRLDILSEKYSSMPILRDEVMVVCRTDYPLARQKTVALASLRNERFILLESKSHLTKLFIEKCEDEGFFPNAPLHHSRHRMLLKAVEKGMGISVMPACLVRTYFSSTLALVRLEKPFYSTMGFIWLKGNQPTELMLNFMNSVKTSLTASALDCQYVLSVDDGEVLVLENMGDNPPLQLSI